MSTRTLVMPVVAGIALMAFGCSEATDPVPPPPPPPPPPPVTYPSVDVTPRTATLDRGARLSLYIALKGFADDGTNRTPIWTSSNSAVVEVSRLIVNGASSSSIPSAIAYAAGVGNATITVWVAGQSASVPVTVTDPRGQKQ